jgi:branched-chain amino acid transport system permease protein/urea transport system permease protein
VQYVLNAGYSSILLLLVAAGLGIIFGLMGVINLAHGEFLMLGAYGALITTDHLGSYWLALLVSPLAVAALAAVVEVGIIRRLYRRPLETIVATWGLAIVIREVVRQIAGSDFRSVESPLPGSTHLLGTDFPRFRLVVMGLVVAILVALYLVQRLTRLGVVARAVIANPDLAGTLGVNVKLVYAVTFAVGSALAGLAGVLIAPSVNVFPDMGPPFVITAFLAVLVGGLGSLPGLVGAAVILGTVQTSVAQWANPVAGGIALLALAVFVLRFMPNGLSRRAA